MDFCLPDNKLLFVSSFSYSLVFKKNPERDILANNGFGLKYILYENFIFNKQKNKYKKDYRYT